MLDVLRAVATGRGFIPSQLSAKEYFHSGFLTMVLSEVLPEVANRAELPLAKAVDRLDKKLAKVNLAPQGDVTWNEMINTRPVEATARLYAGLPDAFAAILAGEGTFEVIFLSELADGTWVLTGLADEMERRITTKGPRGRPSPVADPLNHHAAPRPDRSSTPGARARS